MTRIVAAPSLAAASVTKAPVTLAVTTCGGDDDAVKLSASSSGSTNAPATSTFTVSPGAKRRFGRVPASAGDRFIGTWVRSATIENESPQMRVGSGGASSMPPQQRNSIEINAPGEWKP